MIPSPNKVNWSYDRANEVMRGVEAHLTKDKVEYTIERGMRVVEVIVPGHLNDFDKAAVVTAMTNHCWLNVSVKNSGDGEERAGLVCVHLEAKPDLP